LKRPGILAAGLSAAVLFGPGSRAAIPQPQGTSEFQILFVSTRDDPAADPALEPLRTWSAAEIYVMNEAATSVRRLTRNSVVDLFPAASPDGRRVVFDSTRRRTESEPYNTSDLFVMNADGSDPQFLVRGSSATWSPDGRHIAFHASASGKGLPIKRDPGAATDDSDIFVLDGDDGLRSHRTARNVTNNPGTIDDDPDWSPDGKKIVFTSHAVTDDAANSATAEIYALNILKGDSDGKAVRLTNNAEEERAPSWSPDGTRIVFCCRRGGADFEICVMNAEGTAQRSLTDNSVPDLTPTWSSDGRKIVFHRPVGGAARFQLFSMNADGTAEKQLTFPPGLNAFPNWGPIRPQGAGASR
jgi:Tol biopolymer transport system component